MLFSSSSHQAGIRKMVLVASSNHKILVCHLFFHVLLANVYGQGEKANHDLLKLGTYDTERMNSLRFQL